MRARRERILHDHSCGVVVSGLQTALFELRKTQAQTSVGVVRILVEQLAKDLFSLFEVAFAQCAIAFANSLLVGETGSGVRRAGKRKTKYEGGHTEGRHPKEMLLIITLHDSRFLSDLPRACNYYYFKTSPVFMDQRTRSSSSKSMPMSRANPISCCSTSRYFLRVEGGLAESITPISAKHLITCLSRIAWPFTPMFRRK